MPLQGARSPSNHMKQVIVIPARMNGTRLPGKPLIEILGKTIIWRVWDRCRQVINSNDIYIATEDKIIYDFCKEHGINCVITGPAGTAIDRIKLFSDKVSADAYINVQGDEPIVNPEDIKAILEYNSKHPNRVVFGKTKANEVEFKDVSKAKVVCDIYDKLLYSSRAGIPIDNNGNFISSERAIWIYAFNREALEKYYEYKDKTPLEKIEDNEIIRFLEIGIPVYCVDVIGDSWAVDTPEDVEIVKHKLENKCNKPT